MLASDKELCFTALGPSGAGKTTLLACMQKNFEELLPGYFYPADPKTFSTLNTAYKKLEAEANSQSIEFAVGVEGTSDLRQYAFTIKGKNANLPVRFFDFPGGWMNPHDESQAENYEQVINIVQRSMVILVAINTPYIMEYDGRYKDYAGVDEIQYVIKTSLINSDSNKLIIFVPIKCERYTSTSADSKQMRDKIKEVFDETLKLSTNPVYKDRLAVALLPVHTVGNARFSRFSIRNGEITQEVYLKNRSIKFSPKDADQPLRFAMSFLLNEFAKGQKNSLLKSLFSSNADLLEMGNFIRSEMKVDYEDFEILCGKEMITEAVKNTTSSNESSYSFKRQDLQHNSEYVNPNSKNDTARDSSYSFSKQDLQHNSEYVNPNSKNDTARDSSYSFSKQDLQHNSEYVNPASKNNTARDSSYSFSKQNLQHNTDIIKSPPKATGEGVTPKSSSRRYNLRKEEIIRITKKYGFKEIKPKYGLPDLEYEEGGEMKRAKWYTGSDFSFWGNWQASATFFTLGIKKTKYVLFGSTGFATFVMGGSLSFLDPFKQQKEDFMSYNELRNNPKVTYSYLRNRFKNFDDNFFNAVMELKDLE